MCINYCFFKSEGSFQNATFTTVLLFNCVKKIRLNLTTEKLVRF